MVDVVPHEGTLVNILFITWALMACEYGWPVSFSKLAEIKLFHHGCCGLIITV